MAKTKEYKTLWAEAYVLKWLSKKKKKSISELGVKCEHSQHYKNTVNSEKSDE